MARAGRPTVAIVLTEEERETLGRWARFPKSAQSLALRYRMVLACAAGGTNGDVGGSFTCTPQPRVGGTGDSPPDTRTGYATSPAGYPPVDHRRRRRLGDREDAGGDANRSDPLFQPVEGWSRTLG